MRFVRIWFSHRFFRKIGTFICQSSPSKNYQGAKDFPAHVQKFLTKEKQYAAFLEPFKSNPFDEKVIISPLNTVPKKDSEDRRVILDLSFPKGDSVNDHVSEDFYLGERINLTYPGIDVLIDIFKT